MATKSYLFNCVFKKAGVGSVPSAAPLVTIVDTANNILVNAQACTALTNMPGAYVYTYVGAYGLDLIGKFATTDATMDEQELFSYTPPIAALVWDEIMSAATHNIATSAGRRLRQLGSPYVYDGVVGAGGATPSTVDLDADASTQDDIYRGDLAVIKTGLGTGQARTIVEYIGSTLKAFIEKPWTVEPLPGDEIIILANSQELVVSFGTVVGVAAGTLKLAATESAVDNIYRYCLIMVTSATGADTQVRLITSYTGSNQTAGISPDWTTLPVVGDIYKIIGVGLSATESMSAGAVSAEAVSEAAVTKLQAGLAKPADVCIAVSAAVAVAVATGALAVEAGYTLRESITSTLMEDLATASKLWLAVKDLGDEDEAALIFLEKTDGLTRVNGAVYGTPTDGSLAVSGAAGAWVVTIVIDEAATGLLFGVNGTFCAGLKAEIGDNEVAVWEGLCAIVDGVVRAV